MDATVAALPEPRLMPMRWNNSVNPPLTLVSEADIPRMPTACRLIAGFPAIY